MGRRPEIRTNLLDELRRRQLSDGAWGYREGLPGVVEPTALAILALDGSTDAPTRIPAERGRGWLAGLQRADGSWPHSAGVPGSSWMTGLAVLTLSRGEGGDASARSGALWLLDQRGRGVPWHVRLRDFLFREEPAVALDPTLKGWPWVDGTSSWVEPTAYALLALEAARIDLPGPDVEARVREGERLLVDRMCPGGGWNYGNSRVLGEELEPYPDTTALALMVLHRAPDAAAAVGRSLLALRRLLERNDSLLTLSLSVLAFRLHGEPVGPLRARLAARADRHPEGGTAPDTRSLAFAALALDRRARPFGLAASGRRMRETVGDARVAEGG